MDKKRVLVVGGGAAGMATAYLLSNHPEKYAVTLFERQPACGGQATSEGIDSSKFGADYINDGVQGGSDIFLHTFNIFKEVAGEEKGRATEVEMQISFDKGSDKFWSNVFPSERVHRLHKDIKKFGKVLRLIKHFELIFGLVPLRVLLPIFQFSPEFQQMVYQLIALFLGTGNQTPYVASAIPAHLFLDQSVKLFDYSDKTLLANVPNMYAFPELRHVYSEWRDVLLKRGVRVQTNHEVVGISNRCKGPIKVQHRDAKVDIYGKEKATVEAGEVRTDTFDELVLAFDAETSLKILGADATFMEKRVLGNVVYKDDITVTHNDNQYMSKYYETAFKEELKANVREKDMDKTTAESFEFGRRHFSPLYFTRSYNLQPQWIEMSFDLNIYQPQMPKDRPFSDHLFQTIFLDAEHCELWSRDEIAKDKVILEKWWHQLSHRWQHFLLVSPQMMFINGKNHTTFAGSWTLVNMHEIAIVSGMAAAYRLGASYPYLDNQNMKRLFTFYFVLAYGCRLRRDDRAGWFM